MLHITSIEDGEASWQVRGQHPEMESFTDYRSTVPAYRMRLDGSTVAIPNGTPGVVYFGEDDARPDLALVREWFPQHWKLWDAVRAAYWDAVVPLDYSRCQALSEAAYDCVTGGRDNSDESRCRAGESGRRAGGITLPSRGIGMTVRELLEAFHRDTGTKLRLDPTDGRILLERADASVCEVGEDGWPIDDSLDMADAVDLEPTDRTN